jgi:Arm DNA-binding domain
VYPVCTLEENLMGVKAPIDGVKTLTDAAVRKYRPAGKRRVIRDLGGRSLYLVIHPTGAKSWMMRFRRSGGKAGKIVLGPLHASDEPPGEPTVGMPLTLAGARQVAAQVHRDRALGRATRSPTTRFAGTVSGPRGRIAAARRSAPWRGGTSTSTPV